MIDVFVKEIILPKGEDFLSERKENFFKVRYYILKSENSAEMAQASGRKRIAQSMSRRNGRLGVPMKYWMWTLNNPTEEHVPPNVWPDVEYTIWQHERGDNGTEHIQGYVCFTQKKRVQWLKEHCDENAHWEPRNGTHEQARDYCSKADTRIDGPWTHGDESKIPTKKGERTDLKRVYAMLSSGKTEHDIMTDPDLFPVWARYYRAIERFELLSQPKRSWITYTQVYWGTSGCGKSRRAHYEASLKADGSVGEPYYVLRKPQNAAVYWDGYKGEKHIIIDEFYGWIPRTMMQVLCDRYPAIIDTKGGARNFLATKIWITSNDAPKDWWNRIGLGAMTRRLEGEFGNVTEMNAPWAPPGEVPAPLPMNVAPVYPAELVSRRQEAIDYVVNRIMNIDEEADAYLRAQEDEEQALLQQWMDYTPE